MRPISTVFLALLACAALVAGCGSSKKSSSSSSSATATAPPATTSTSSGGAAPSAGGGGATVEDKMQNIAFAPSTLHAKVGDTVKWTNEDSVDHNVVAKGAQSFSSPGTFGQGGTYSVKLTKPGTISFVCTLHPATMSNGKIIVTK